MSSNESPVITVVVAAYNCVDTIQQCIDSVVEQSYKKWELIVIDGGSTDGTADLLGRNNEISYWISEPDTGIYNAWNKALLKSTGDWICFLGGDDFLFDVQALDKMVGELNKLSVNVFVAYGRVMILNENSVPIYPVGERWENVRKRFRYAMSIPHQGVMHRRDLFVKYGVFNESFRIGGDYDLLLRFLKNQDAVFFPDVIFSAMRLGGVSSNPSGTLLVLQEFRKAQINNGIRLPSIMFLFLVAKVYARIFIWRLLGERSAKRVLDIGRRLVRLPAHWTKV
ncbi:MAG: glycosyltransferase family 2 protein [Ferribacterium limneticum]